MVGNILRSCIKIRDNKHQYNYPIEITIVVYRYKQINTISYFEVDSKTKIWIPFIKILCHLFNFQSCEESIIRQLESIKRLYYFNHWQH